MGESTCLMQQTFSHSSSDNFHESKECNPLQALGESISFGKFMSEPLAWEKWSSFNNNRYLEEVEKYSTPGSVAQKKAYFEAHYKKIAAQKAAAALEAQNLESNNYVEQETDKGVGDGGLDCQVGIDKPREGEVSISNEGFPIDTCGSAANCETVGYESNVVDVDPVMEIQNVEDSLVPTKSPDQHEDSENKLTNEVETNTTLPSDKLPLKENSSANQESAAIKMKPIVSSSKILLKARASTPLSSPARPKTPVKPKTETNSNVDCKKIAKDIVDKTRTTPASLYMSINSIPSPAGETNKIGTPILHKTRDARVDVNLTKATKDGAIPLRTPARASVSGVRKLLPVTPCPDVTRTKVLHEQTTPSRKKDVKWQSLCADNSKSSSLFGDKTSRCSVSSSFSLRSEERAAKRKEYYQKLEEELKAKEAQKMQLQANSKEKDENELRKFRQNLGFKAKPMPNFYHEAQEAKTQIKKIPVTRPRSPKLGRKPSSSITHEANSLPPKRPSVKSDGSKQGLDKASRTPTRSVTRTPKKNAHENASPNIQS